jgi:[protein-PII] uridylyltransferase
VGGYGRGELHPESDIDILILVESGKPKTWQEAISQFVTLLWDIGLEVGQSVRTPKECCKMAANDLTVTTNLIESRVIYGEASALDQLKSKMGSRAIWHGKDFFIAKSQEQAQRHKKFDDNAYNLEPNIKEGIGGLRDIHTLFWIAKRYFQTDCLNDLVTRGLLLQDELDDLILAQNALWQIRFALHLVAGRHEERLLFDYQKTVAAELGFPDDDINLGVEKLMHFYFRTATEVSRLNDMLMQLFREVILIQPDKIKPVKINSRFQIRNGYIETTHPNLFKRYPHAMLEIFLHTLQNSSIKGISASAIRQIRHYQHLIDDTLRSDIRAQSLFMEIIRQHNGAGHELYRMHSYGVLGRYIPEFLNIEGRMQYDLFHTLTVDSHILTTVKYLREFSLPENEKQLPFCFAISKKIPKPELLYLAGLFHDIGKGREGDHSDIGAEDAYLFCIRHALSEYDSQLVSWLVRHHLLMSVTAQRKDISDPDVIHEFCSIVENRTRLDYLYLLTVADIRATNPELWNDWRASLLRELYRAAERFFRRGFDAHPNLDHLAESVQNKAQYLLADKKIHHMRIKSLWKTLPTDYFIRFTPEEIAWHTESILKNETRSEGQVMVKPESYRGGTELFIYEQDRPHLFALMCSILDFLSLSILDARIMTSLDGMTLDNYLVVEAFTGAPIENEERSTEITTKLQLFLRHPEMVPPLPPRKLPRKLKHFTTPTEVIFHNDPSAQRTLLEIITGDRPGLLAEIGKIFIRHNLRVENARIATVGERAEDIFYITDQDRKPIDQLAAQTRIRDDIKALLDS